jgi:hypothetical protein
LKIAEMVSGFVCAWTVAAANETKMQKLMVCKRERWITRTKLRQVGIFLSGQKSTNQCTGALPAFHQQGQWTDKPVLQVPAAGAAFGNDLNSSHCILAIWTKPSKN